MRQLGVQRVFSEPAHEFTMNAEPGMGDLNHLLMLAIERALAPPIVHRRSTLQPMRVVVVDREMFLSDEERDEIGCEMPRLLPRAAQRSRHAEWQFQQRSVRGEILSDESGRLYEKLGRQIRPLHQLASGPFGEVIDLVPAPQAGLRGYVSAPQPQVVESHQETSNASVDETAAVTEATANSKFVPVQEPAKQAGSVSHRKLFADPGQWRVLAWGEFKEVLSSQLAHPERLRDTYRLPCYVQVFETDREVAISELAGIFKSDPRRAHLYFLTDEIAAKLDLVLPLRAAPPQNTPRPPNTLLSHERVFRLIVANDPTIDIANIKSKQDSVSNTEATQTSLKCAIPARFVKEWELKISRDEALYDMNAKLTLGGVLLKICRRLRVGKYRKEISKWQVLLMGKDLDEQLWAVRPPKDQLTDSQVRDWARRTLELGGYDSSKMIIEWEVFWRRRAL
jgi:hypothetical protein